MRECDIWADREPGSCGGAPEKSPLKPFVLFSIEKKERLGDLALRVCVRTTLYCNLARGEVKHWIHLRLRVENTSLPYLRTVSFVQHVSNGMLYPTSWPMLTSISSATRKARSTACCA